MQKHMILTCLSGSKIDLKASATAQEVMKICQEMHEFNHIIACETGFPVRCPACHVIVSLADYPDSHSFCKTCGPLYQDKEMEKAIKLSKN